MKEMRVGLRHRRGQRHLLPAGGGEPLEPLCESGKLGPVLWQLPGNFHRDDAALAGALEQTAAAGPPLLRVPPSELVRPGGDAGARGPRASLVIPHDGRRPLPPARPAGEVAYLRLHYGARGRNGNYSAGELDRWRGISRLV